MKLKSTVLRAPALASALILTSLLASPAFAHCDSMAGPVVKDAQAALASKSVDQVLKWVDKSDEVTIRDAFAMTLAVRGESAAAKSIADKYFFETLVRIHRATEGEGFTGLKPAEGVDPMILSADRALATGNSDQLADEISGAVRAGVKRRFADAYAKRQLAAQSVEQGREYVDSYVEFTHFVIGADHLTVEGPSHQHSEAPSDK